MPGPLELEAQFYWDNVRRLRLTSVLEADKAEIADDLEVVALHTESAVIRRDINRALGRDTLVGLVK